MFRVNQSIQNNRRTGPNNPQGSLWVCMLTTQEQILKDSFSACVAAADGNPKVTW